MKSISTSTYTFEKLIKGNYVYVDKTGFFYKLIKGETGQYFCSRPRRFGKSLAISTFEAIFRGKRDLFRELDIYDMDYDWEEYPVVHLDMAGMDIVTEERTNIGRIDAVLKTEKHLYIVEFKCSKTADEAVEQIDEKKYAEKYIIPARERGQAIHKLGINFCCAGGHRNIVEWKEC